MQLLDIPSHMPFLYGETLFFCISPGVREFRLQTPAFSLRKDRPPQVVEFQPWQLAYYRDGKVTAVRHTLRTDNPARVFCNPVMGEGAISFIYGRRLYSAQLINDCLTRIVEAADKLFTGFLMDGKFVTGIPPCIKSQAQLVISGVGYRTGFDELLRVIPQGPDLLLTGQRQGKPYSVLVLKDGSSSRLKVNGNDIYKCCLDSKRGTVIHAVKGEQGERYLHSDPVELYSIPNFLAETN